MWLFNKYYYEHDIQIINEGLSTLVSDKNTLFPVRHKRKGSKKKC